MKAAQAEQAAATLGELAAPGRLDVALRPHLKTSKSVDAARRVMTPSGPATVSTLLEAEQFAAAGVRDIISAVGITPSKLPQVLALRAGGADVSVVGALRR